MTMHQALSLGRNTKFALGAALALDHAAWLHHYRGEARETLDTAEADLKLTTEHGFSFFLAQGTILRGWALAKLGQNAEGITRIKQGLGAHAATGAQLVRPYWMALLAGAYADGGKAKQGLHLLGEAFAMAGDQHLWSAELHRMRGELLLLSGRAASDEDLSVTEAELCFRQALAIASGQRAKALELRAATSLARLWRDQGKRAEAFDLLAPVYGWFTEGLSTSVLQEAKALLAELMP